ncbi:conserved protein of unknown function [Streptomyces murinus]
MYEKCLAAFDTELSQPGGDAVPSDKRPGRRGCGHGRGVFRTGARDATGFRADRAPDDRSEIIFAGQIRYA